MTDTSQTPVQVGEWRVEPDRNLIRRGDEAIRMDPRALDVLVYLAREAPRTVPADELLNRFWAGRVVESSTVHRVISRIRTSLGDQAKDARYIETVPKRGYRMVATVSVDEPATPRPAPSLPTKTEFLDLPRATASLTEESGVLNLGRIPVTKGRCTIGRGEDNDLPLADGSISHRHARLALGTAGWRIEDLGSTNGLYVNDAYLSEAALADGDLIQLGRVKLRFRLD